MAVKTKEELQEYLKNEHVQWFLHNVLSHESDSIEKGGLVNYGGFNQGGGNSSAFGAGQFIGSTRKEVIDAYGVDAWSNDLNEQLMATIALLDMDRDLDKVASGDFESVFGVSDLKKNKKGEMLGGSRWQAFYPKGHRDYVKSSQNLTILGARPEGWKNKYNMQLSTAVYDPEYSWNKILTQKNGKKIQQQKIELYNRSYSDSIPDSLNAAVPQILAKKEPKTTQPSISATEGLDMDPITAAGDQTQTQDPTVIPPTVTPEPIITDLPTKDEWIENKLIKEKETEAVEKQDQENIINNGQTIEQEKEEEVVENEIKQSIEKDKEDEFPGLLPEVTVTADPVVEEDVVEEDDVVEDVVEDDVVEPELIKPKPSDFSTSSDYMKARMEYYKKLEEREEAKTAASSIDVDTVDTEQEVVQDDEEVIQDDVSDETITETDQPDTTIDSEQEVESEIVEEDGDIEIELDVINNDSTTTTIPVTIASSGFSLEDYEAGMIATAPPGTTNVVLPSQMHPYDLIPDLPSSNLPGMDAVDSNIFEYELQGKSRDELSQMLKQAANNKDGELVGVLRGLGALAPDELEQLKKEEEIAQKKQAEIDAKSNTGGNEYAENIAYRDSIKKQKTTNTINLLKEKYPDLNFDSVRSKEDWFALSAKPTKDGGLGAVDLMKSSLEWDLTIGQFDEVQTQTIKETKDSVRDKILKDPNGENSRFTTEEEIELAEGVWDWLTHDSRGGEAADIDLDDMDLKISALNLIPRSEWVKLYNTHHSIAERSVDAIASTERRLGARETILSEARNRTFPKKLKRLDPIKNEIVADGIVFDNDYASFETSVNEFSERKEDLQEELDLLTSKYGKYQVGSDGKLFWKQKEMMSKEDASRLNEINAAIGGLEDDRGLIKAKRKSLIFEQERMNKLRTDYNDQWEGLVADYNWNIQKEQFNPAFTATQEWMDWNESIKNNFGKTADVLTTFGEEWLRLKVLIKGINPATLKAGLIATTGTLIADLTAESWEHSVYKYPPHDTNEYNEGYSHTGTFFDMLKNIATQDLFPTSQDKTGDIVQHSKMDLERRAELDEKYGKGGRFAVELYDKMAPGWAGGKGNWSMYSTSKTFAELLPYTMNIMAAYRGATAQSAKFGKINAKGKWQANTKGIFDGRSKIAKQLGVNKGIGKKIVSSLNKEWLTSPAMMGRLNMLKVNHKMTFFDNYADGRARGLSTSQAFSYGNWLSLATGFSQMIMPDYNWIKSTAGKNIINSLTNSLKTGSYETVGKTVGKIAKESANRAAFKTATKNLLKEYAEEEIDVGLQDIVKSSYLANHSPEIFDVNMQAEILSATTVLTVPLGSISAVRTRNNVRNKVYKLFGDKGAEIIRSAQQEASVIQEKINKTGNSKKDKILRKELIKEQNILEKQISEAQRIRAAINVSPDNVTDTQIDLLVQKQKLLDRKSKLNKKDKSLYEVEIEKINKELVSIDDQIKEHSSSNYHDKLYTALLKGAKKLAPALGFTLKHISVDEETYRISVEKEKEALHKRNLKKREEIEKIRKSNKTKIQKQKEITAIEKTIEADRVSFDSPGHIKYQSGPNGEHHIIINENAAKWFGNDAVVLHEMLHVMLWKTINNHHKAKNLKGLAYLLKKELQGNPDKYAHHGYVIGMKKGDNVSGKFDQYKFDKEVNNMAFDEMFTVFLEALAQGDISVKGNVITKIGDVIRRMFRAHGINFTIKSHKGMVNFLRDFQKEMVDGRFSFNEKTGQQELSEGMMKILNEGLDLKVSQGAIDKANQWEARMMRDYDIDRWDLDNPKIAKSIVGKKGRTNIYKDKKIQSDLKLSEQTRKIVEENEKIRKLILEEGITRDGKIVASEDLVTRLVENNLALAVSLGNFAAQNPKIMGLEEGKRVTAQQFISGYYLQLSKLAGTYDASINEFGQYLNTILPLRYGNILEAEKQGAMEGAQGLDFIPEPADDTDDDTSTPDDVYTGPKIDTAERLGVKDKTKKFIDKSLKQIKQLEDLQVKMSEKQDDKTALEIAELTADLESKGVSDLDIESLTVKQAPNLLYKFVGELFGIDEDKLNPNSNKWLANLRKKEGKRGSNEVRSAQRAVARHAQLILSTIFNDGHTAAFKSSGMPNVLLKFGYNKRSKRIGNNYPQIKKPNLSETDLLKFVGIEKVTKNGITGFKFTVDRNTGTKLLAIAQMVDRNMSLQAINENLVETGDMTPKIKGAIEDGMSKSSKSIYYIRSNDNIKDQIQDKLHELSYRLENVDEDWTQEEIKKVFKETFEDTDVKWTELFKDLFKATGILTRYVARVTRGESFMTLEEFTKQELGQLEIEKGLFKMLGLKVKNKGVLYTKKNIKKARTRTAKLAKSIEDSYINGDLSEKEAMELLFLLEQQHITAAKIGNGKWWALPGKNAFEDAYYPENKKTKDGKKHPLAGTKVGESSTQRDQLFGSKKGAPLDFRMFINNKLKGGKKGLQLGLSTKENNAIKDKLGITKLFAQKSKSVIESLIKDDFDFKGRKKEALLARKLVKMQVNFYSELYNKGEITAEEFAMHMLTFGSNMSTASRRAANVHGIQKGILSNITSGKYIYGLLKNIGVDLEYEHGKPHEQLILELVEVGLTKKEKGLKEKALVKKDKPMPWESTEMDNVFTDYEVNIITKLMDKTLTASNRKSSMGFGYVKGLAQGWVQRMFNEENFGDPRVGAIVSVDGNNTIYGEGHEKITKVLRKPVGEIKEDRKVSKGMESARSINYSRKTKGITILDFDDTLATSNSKVISTAPDGNVRKLTAEEFANEGADLLDAGWVHDFSEFNKVVDGKVASLFKKALKLQKKFGPKNMFILTARPLESARSIQQFLKANGLNISLKNITGLGNSTPEAKALWVAKKAGEGYNDFYFADDALQNVQAVNNVLEQLDVKRKVQQAKNSKSIDYNRKFNEILEETTGEGAEKVFSKAKAQRRGEGRGDWNIFIPPSADDFVGLIYNFLSKGKNGERQFKWFKEVLLNPLNRAYRELDQAKQAISNDYKKLGKQLPEIRKKLFSKISGSDFTYNDAIRVYLWSKFGFKIDGLSETDRKNLVSIVEKDQNLIVFADALSVISRSKDGYIPPSETWITEDIRTDLMNANNNINRKVFFQEFLENMNIIFSKENLNKIEAVYGKNFRDALEDMLYRIENGTNRSFGSNMLVNRFMNWINGAIGTTMFFNSRSALLQTMSTVNFINWEDNNVIAAAKAFANQKQFWADFIMIFNSDMLKQRRSGKSFDLNSSELADYVSNSKQPFRSAINWLLQKGFLPTQIMDSFAIAAGGSTFYRNRLNTYLLQGDSLTLAKEKAFADFQGIAEATQQSARQDMISQQQASVLGRLILAFQNTPMQYARLMKKSILDLKDGRGDPKANISRIVYYGAVQNLIFYSMQTALFAMMFSDDDDDEKWLEKKERVINGSLDSLLRGMGVGGAVTSTLKNMIIKLIEEQGKPRNRRDESAVLMELLNLSPPIGIKSRQIKSGTQTINWNEEEISKMPLYNLDNPLWEAGFNYTQAVTNVPLARIHTKVSNIRESLNKENEAWQRIAMFGGWSKWNLGVRKKSKKKSKKKKSFRKTIF